LFFGEIGAVYVNKKSLTDGKTDPLKVHPMIPMGNSYCDFEFGDVLCATLSLNTVPITLPWNLGILTGFKSQRHVIKLKNISAMKQMIYKNPYLNLRPLYGSSGRVS